MRENNEVVVDMQLLLHCRSESQKSKKKCRRSSHLIASPPNHKMDNNFTHHNHIYKENATRLNTLDVWIPSNSTHQASGIWVM